MEFEGIVSQILEQVKGQSARGEWVKQDVVFDCPDGQYSRKVCVSFWNERAPRASMFKIGERALVSINIESREHNGRWYTEIRGWKIDAPRVAAPADGAYPAANQVPAGSPYPAYSTPTSVPAQTATSAAPAAPEASGADDLPF